MIKLRPSQAARIIQCPGSVKAAEGFKDPPTQYALEGIATHWVAEQKLKGREVGPKDNNGTVITDEMIDCAMVYVRDFLQRTYGRGHVEKTVRIEALKVQGIPDAFDDEGDELILWDYKHGILPVSPLWNWQLLCYALELVKPNTKKIELRIIQPRSYDPEGPIKVWSPTLDQLNDAKEILVNAFNEARSDSPSFKAGKECRYCPARGSCSVLRDAGENSMCLATRDITTRMEDKDIGVQLSRVEDAIKLLEYQKTGLQAEVEQRLREGKTISNYSMVAEKPREVWEHPEKIQDVFKTLGIDVSRPNPMTPKQIKAKWPHMSTTVDALKTEKPQKAKLKRVKQADIERIFK